MLSIILIKLFHSVLPALQLMESLKFSDAPVEHYNSIARACVTHLIRVCSVKKHDLYSTLLEAPEAVNPITFQMQDMVQNWVSRVGDMRHTMHWSSSDLMPMIQRLNHMPLPELRSAFEYWDCLYVHMKGIADVLFTASCFQIPFVVRLGDLFWAFARELLLVKIDSSDDLNLFLSGSIMPQTVIVLGPHTYLLDSEVPQIQCNVTIKGSPIGVDNSTFSQTTISLHDNGLAFQSGVFIQDVCFVHRAPAALNCAIRVQGIDKRNTRVRLEGVKVVGGGIRFSQCREVNMYELYIENALVGVYVNDVDMLSVNPRLDPQQGFVYSDKAYFELCQTVFYITKAKYFCSCFQVFHQCTRIYHACIDEKMAILDSDFLECGKLGQVLGSQGASMLLCRCYVSQLLSIVFI